MAKPTAQQLSWAQAEFGVIIHYDITVFEPSYNFRKQWGYHPDPKVFAPTALDTDQWVKTAKEAGAKYAILVAKHCTGFCLFPTEPYSVRQSAYQGDIVESFVRSCRKYDIKPWLYYSCACNGYMQADNPGYVISKDPEQQKQYAALCERQLTKLWSRYGEMFEIWFDGGLLPVEQGGPNLKPIYEAYQPKAVRFQGSQIGEENNTRWVGNERGLAPFNCWSATDGDSQFDGTKEDSSIGEGNPDGARWSPAECDMPNRRNEWIWKAGEDKKVLSAEHLMDCYYQSVGRNCNLLLGMVVDNRGLVPERDVTEFRRFGAMLSRRFQNKTASTSGSGTQFALSLAPDTKIDHIVLRENLQAGHAVRAFCVEIRRNGKTVKKLQAKAIGNKRIFRFNALRADEIRLTITENKGMPDITEFSCCFANDYSAKEKIKLFFKHAK